MRFMTAARAWKDRLLRSFSRGPPSMILFPHLITSILIHRTLKAFEVPLWELLRQVRFSATLPNTFMDLKLVDSVLKCICLLRVSIKV